ncbi:Putative thiol oxidoreductase with 2 cytochrome c heme-binding site [Minicystis rosea]|nr:Putative thiol oxidoreductase with 2 cytochrome c heme-binding site [Minicystis rosea]
MKLRALVLVALCGCGDLFSRQREPDQTFDVPLDGLTGVQLAVHAAGDDAFGTRFSPETGLGPVYDAESCDACHPGGGKGDPLFHLVRFGVGDEYDPATFNPLVELGGPQLQDHAIPGYVAERLPDGVAVSFRSGPVVVGLGLLEAIPVETIVALADADDANGDGISGRPSFVPVPAFIPVDSSCGCAGCQLRGQVCTMLGRFGRKARTVSLLHQAASAFHDDIGITSDIMPVDVWNPAVGGPSGDAVTDPEISASTLDDVVFYVRTLRPPARRNADDPSVLRGESVFASLGCVHCHIPTLETGPSDIGPLSHVTVHAYTDLLLHDMGDGLADHLAEGDATGHEWRTTPLWGIGIIASQIGGRQFYLHDGSAPTLEDAIYRHGGEARKPRDAFAALPTDDRDALLAFLRSL